MLFKVASSGICSDIKTIIPGLAEVYKSTSEQLPKEEQQSERTGHENQIPHSFKLAQNYPNPFNPQTKITFELPTPEHVVITIYNIKGQLIKQLLDENRSAGIHQLKWNAVNEPAGIYLCKIRAGEFSQTIKLMLLK